MGVNIDCPKCKTKLKEDCFSKMDFTCPECHAELQSNGPLLMGTVFVVSVPISVWLYSLVPESIPMLLGLLPLELFVAVAVGIPLSLLLRITAAP